MPERVEVGPRAGGLAAQALRGQVLGGAADRPRPVPVLPGEPEVDQLHRDAAGGPGLPERRGGSVADEDVRGLQVEVQEAASMERVEGVEEPADGRLEPRIGGDRPGSAPVGSPGRDEVARVGADVPALDQLHREEGPASRSDPEVQRAHEPRVRVRGEQPELLSGEGGRPGIAPDGGLEDLDRHVAILEPVVRPDDGARAALAEPSGHAVPARELGLRHGMGGFVAGRLRSVRDRSLRRRMGQARTWDRARGEHVPSPRPIVAR